MTGRPGNLRGSSAPTPRPTTAPDERNGPGGRTVPVRVFRVRRCRGIRCAMASSPEGGGPVEQAAADVWALLEEFPALRRAVDVAGCAAADLLADELVNRDRITLIESALAELNGPRSTGGSRSRRASDTARSRRVRQGAPLGRVDPSRAPRGEV